MFSSRRSALALALTIAALATACQDSTPTEVDESASDPFLSVAGATGTTTVKVGQSIQLTSKRYKPRTGDFISTDSRILKVKDSGVATGVAPGSLRVIYKTRLFADTQVVMVVAASSSAQTIRSVKVALPMPSVTIGQIQTASAVALDSLGATVPVGAVSTTVWKSSNTAVATISATGAVTAVASGTASISATISGVTGSSTLTVNASTPNSPPPSGSSTSSPAALPQVQVDVRWVQPTGRTITVSAGGNLQSALNSALPGDEVVLQAGATFIGNFTLPVKTAGAGNSWILVRTSGTGLPALGQRLTPRSASQLARVLSPNGLPAIKVAMSANHWRLVGLEVSATSAVRQNNTLLEVGEGSSLQNTVAKAPSYITLDRLWVHGSNSLQVRRCVGLHGVHTAVINSTIDDCVSSGFDSQAIWGWNGPGPFRIENNYLEGSTENVGFGGTTVAIPGLIPSDIEIRGNHIAKPASWKGGPWLVKNLVEFKNGRRILIENNLIEGNWMNGQQGYAIVLTPVAQGGQCGWCTVQDVTIRYNHIRRTGAGFNITSSYDSYVQNPGKRIAITQNLLDEVNTGIYTGTGRLFQLMNHDLNDVTITHNTALGTDISVLLAGLPMARLVITNNVMVSTKGYGVYSANGKPQGSGTLNYHAAGWTFAGNVLAGSSGFVKTHPAGNFYPASLSSVGFTAASALNYILGGASPYRGKATDGTDPGADIPTILARTNSTIVP